jgi:hypothetical protein
VKTPGLLPASLRRAGFRHPQRANGALQLAGDTHSYYCSMETGAGLDGLEAHRGEAEKRKVMTHSALGGARCEVPQARFRAGRRTKDPRRWGAELLAALPLDPLDPPRSPEQSTCSEREREGMQA